MIDSSLPPRPRFNAPLGSSYIAAATSAPEYPVFLLRPPYERPELHTSWSGLTARPRGHGTLAGVRVGGGTAEWAPLERTIREMRQRLPDTPIVLLLQAPVVDGLPLFTRAARAGVRAAVVEGQAMREPLRESLTQTDGLAADVAEWLTRRWPRLSPVVVSLLQQIFEHAPAHPDLSSLLARVGTPETSARFRLHKRRLPPPSRWFQAARALHCALRIQAQPQTGLLRIAHGLGYADHSALSQLVHRAFGLRPGAIRGTLGWEWLMERWVAQTVEIRRGSRA